MEILISSKPKLAFAGVGWIGRSRMQAVAESNLATLAYITDPSEECLVAATKIAPQSNVVKSFEELISSDADAVIIATPSAMHMQQATAAFRKGKAVFCQKPLGRNAAEVSQLVNAAKQYNRLLGADFSYRHTNAFKKILQVIRSGELGKIFSVDLKFHNAYGPDKAWFYDYELSGGGCALDLGIHLLDLALYALDFPAVNKIDRQLFAKGRAITSERLVEDYAAVQMQLATDTCVQMTCSWNLNAGVDAIIEASFYGTNGGVALKNIDGSFYDFEAVRYRGTSAEIIASPPDNWGGKAILDFVEKLSTANAYDHSANDYLKSAEVLDMIYGRVE